MRRFMPMLLLAGSAATVGLAVGYYAAMTGAIGVSQGVVIILALTLVGLLAAFYGGRTPMPANAPIAPADAWTAFRLELDRSRRFERPFVLLRFAEPPARDFENVEPSEARPGISVVPTMLRGIDRVWSVGGSIYVLLPESRRASAEALLVRLRSLTRDDSLLDSVEMAEFPADGLTPSALITNLRPASPSDGEARVWLVQSEHEVGAGRDEQTG